MSEQSPAQWFTKLSPKHKTIVLCKIVYEFTIEIRMITRYPMDTTEILKIKGIGEMTHRIMPYLIALNSEDKERFGDEELIGLLFAAANDYGLGGILQQAWSHAVSQLSPRLN